MPVIKGLEMYYRIAEAIERKWLERRVEKMLADMETANNNMRVSNEINARTLDHAAALLDKITYDPEKRAGA